VKSRLVCIRMTLEARTALENAGEPNVYLWESPFKRCGVWWGLADGHFYRAFPPETIERDVVGVTRRLSDNRWCWEVRCDSLS
jgi:hypothetical protein